MLIKNRKIGLNYPPLVIAEIGINHGGSLEIAKHMVDAAHRSGVEVIKHQTHIVDDEMSALAKSIKPGNSDNSIYDIMKSCALSESEEIELKNYVESKGIIFMSTPFSRAAADRLEKIGVSAYKIGSGECNNYPLVEHIAKFKKPVILSTGMNNIESVGISVEILKDYGVDFALLHTTNLYPTPPHLVRFGGMLELMKEFPDVVVGLSDHTLSNLACFGATALGACILERHFTDTMYRKGPDIINSMDELALKELIFGANEIFLMRGGKKEAALEEEITINFAFATVVAIKDIKKGEILFSDNIWVKRPGVGEIKAKDYKEVIGKVAKRDLKADTHLSWSDIG